MASAGIVRCLSFPVSELPAPLLALLSEFRLVVNESIRIALRQGIRSRFRLTRAAYAILSSEHTIHKQHIPRAFGVALGVLKAHGRSRAERSPRGWSTPDEGAEPQIGLRVWRPETVAALPSGMFIYVPPFGARPPTWITE